MSFANAGKSWTRATLRAYLQTLKPPAWAQGITFHHTAEPALSFPSWRHGWNAQLIANMQSGYQKKGWDRGPHFYPDDHAIWGLTPPTVRGIHAVSFNRSHIGIEVLGNYDTEYPNAGRGWLCWENAFACGAEILRWLKIPIGSPGAINFHRDDPKTSKTCPGTRITTGFVFDGLIRVSQETPASIAPIQHDLQIVVIAEWLSARGLTHKITRTRTGQTLVGGKEIESAHYDPDRQVTLADARELEADLLPSVL